LEGNVDDEDSEDVEAAESIYAKNRKACEDKITFKVRSIGIDLIEDVSITGETGETHVDKKARYVRTMQELNNSFNAFCAKCIGSKFEKVSVTTLAFALKELMEDLFELFETDAVKVILYHGNKEVFADLIDLAILHANHEIYIEEGFMPLLVLVTDGIMLPAGITILIPPVNILLVGFQESFETLFRLRGIL
jgi:hypothetical protein